MQKLAQFVAGELGGSHGHADLAQRYMREADQLKQKNNSLVIRIGELSVGTGRHRALLMKWLADACDLPCRVLRGEFYLGLLFSLNNQSGANFIRWGTSSAQDLKLHRVRFRGLMVFGHLRREILNLASISANCFRA